MGIANKQGEDDESATVNTEAILDMQRKLYRWSYNDPDKVYDDLFNLVCDRRTLYLAWLWMSRNRGSRTPGTDGLTRTKIEKRPGGAQQFLEEIRDELRRGTYRPQPVRQRMIPKPGKPGKFRPLGIPTLRDRLVQMALKIVLEPIYEADFYPTSYGFRRGRSTHDALAMLLEQLRPKATGPSKVKFVIEGDIKGCFDNIDHHILMERLRERIGDRKVLRLILAFLKAGIMIEGTVRNPTVGTPQGGIISPLLANIYLSAIDERYRHWTHAPREQAGSASARRYRARRRGQPTFFLVRYADDFVILVSGSEDDAMTERDALAEFLRQELRMELSLEKTLVTAAERGFCFLGYRVVKERAILSRKPVGKLFIPKEKLQAIRDKIKKTVKDYPTGNTLVSLLQEINPVITGWRNYFRYATGACKEFRSLDQWLDSRIGRWLRRKHRKATWREIGRRYKAAQTTPRIWAEGEISLRTFSQGGTAWYPNKGTRIPNGWNDKTWDGEFQHGDPNFYTSYNLLNRI